MDEVLIAGAAAIHGLVLDVESAWKDRNEKNLDHPIVHGLVSFTSGADDIPASRSPGWSASARSTRRG